MPGKIALSSGLVSDLIFHRYEDHKAPDVPMQNGTRFGISGTRFWISYRNAGAWRDPHINISNNTSGIRIHADDFCKSELPSQCVLVAEPNYVSNGNVPFSSMPLTANEQVRTSELAPGLPEVVDYSLYFFESFEWINGVVYSFEVSTLCGSTKQQVVRRDVLDALFSALNSGVDGSLISKIGS